MIKTPKRNIKPYQAFIKKRLTTESFLNVEMDQTYTTNLTSKIVSSIQSANTTSSKLRNRITQARERLKTQEKQEQDHREKLRSKIQSRMRVSQTNISKIQEGRNKSLSSRSHFEKNQKEKIKEKQRKQLEKSLIQLRDYQSQAEKFFRDTTLKKQLENKRLQKIALQRQRKSEDNSIVSQRESRTRYENNLDPRAKYSAQKKKLNTQMSSKSLTKSDKSRIGDKISRVLKVSQGEIKRKQENKKLIQENKEYRYLSEYITKMEDINKVRKKGERIGKSAAATLPKVVSKEKQIKNITNDYRRASYSIHQKKPTVKASFSEIYSEKLNEKRARKEEDHLALLAEGDRVLEKHREQTRILKQNRLIKDSINEYKRWSNILNK